MKRLLIVTETGDAWPSGFVRALVYADLFARDGIDVRYESRLDPALTKRIEQPSRLFRRMLSSPAGKAVQGLHRARGRRRERRIAEMSPRFDVIYLQKVASASLIREIRARSRARLVYDLNDGLWLPSRASFASGRIEEILRTVDAVTCDNPYGLGFARTWNRAGYLVPDPAQVEAFDAIRPTISRADAPIVVGWIGSRATAFNLFLIWEALERVFSSHPDVTFRILGAGHDGSVLPRFERVRYSLRPAYTQAEMIEEVSRMHIGLFPLFDVEDSLARGFLKAEIYWSGEAALVASPVGQCLDLVRDGTNGLIARSTEEWVRALDALIGDRELRRRISRAGLETAHEMFSLERCYSALKTALFADEAPRDPTHPGSASAPVHGEGSPADPSLSPRARSSRTPA